MSNTSQTRPTMAPDEVAARRDDDELFVLDVRNEDDYEEWHVEGSYNVPIYDQLLDENYVGLEASLDELPDEKEIVVVCVAGVTSARAAEFLRDRGYDARSMADGMNGWGRVHVTYDAENVDGVTQVVRPGTGCVSYLVHDGDEAVVVDPSLYLDEYLTVAADRDVEIVAAIDTHAHADHLSGGRPLADEVDVPYYLHPEDAAALDGYTALEGGEAIGVGNRDLSIRHTPGHTPGSVSLTWSGALLSGDTLFVDGVGRPDLEGSDETDVRAAADDLFDSLDDLGDLPDETLVLPGHFSDEEIRPIAAPLARIEDRNELFGIEERGEFVDSVVESLTDEPANYNRIKAINWGKEPLTRDAADLELGPNNCAAN